MPRCARCLRGVIVVVRMWDGAQGDEAHGALWNIDLHPHSAVRAGGLEEENSAWAADAGGLRNLFLSASAQML